MRKFINLYSERQAFPLADQATVNIRIDRELKNQADTLFSAIGMSLTTAITVFIRQAVQEQAIPFQIQLKKPGDRRQA